MTTGQDRASDVGPAPRLQPGAHSALQVLNNAIRHVLVEVATDTLRCIRLVHRPVSFKGWGHVGCAHGPMPVGETGGAKVRGRKSRRGITQAAQAALRGS